MNVPMVWIMGAPCSGKGTQSEKIANKYGFKHIDPSLLVDKEIDTKTEAGQKFEAIRAKGQEVALAEIVPMIEKEIMNSRGGLSGLVIDGYPGSMQEAGVLEQRIGSPDMIVCLQIPEEAAAGRTSRAPSTVSRKSVSEYNGQARQVLDKYARITLQVDGEQEPDKVFEVIQKSMDQLVKSRGQIKIAR